MPSLDALFDPVPILALIAKRVRGIDVGTSVTESIRRHPMSLAQSFVTLDHISKGRAILGIGNGIRENTEPYGLPYGNNVERLEEAITIIRLLWSSNGEPVDYDGHFWQLRDAVFRLPLYRGRQPRLFVAAHFPRMLRLAGRYGDGWLPGQKVTAEEYGKRLGIIRTAAEKAGRDFERIHRGADAARGARRQPPAGPRSRHEEPGLRQHGPRGDGGDVAIARPRPSARREPRRLPRSGADACHDGADRPRRGDDDPGAAVEH